MANPNAPLPNLNLGPHIPAPLPLLQQLRRSAGPQLRSGSPPWHRPGSDPATGPHDPPWPGRAANWSIPLVVPVAQQPDGATVDQRVVNAFLRRLQIHFNQRLGNPHEGPLVLTHEVSSVNANHRLNTVESAAVPGAPGAQRVVGLNPHNPTALALREYSMTAQEAAAASRAARGTLILIASRAPPLELRNSSATRRFLAAAGNPANQGGGPAVAAALGPWLAANVQPGVDIWHNTAVFLQSRNDWPQFNVHLHNQGRPASLCYTFNGTRRVVYVYDPSYINESPPAPGQAHGLVTARLNQRNESRLREHLFHRNTQALLITYLGGVGIPGPGRMQWVRNAGVVRIGGGGNIDPLSECRRMACTWIQQVGYLSQRLNTALAQFHAGPTPATLAAFQDADREFTLFFRNYTVLNLA